MATKTIKVPVTLHLPAKDHVPFTWGALGEVTKGKYSIDVIPPNTPVELDADEADALLARYKVADEKPSEKAAEKTGFSD